MVQDLRIVNVALEITLTLNRPFKDAENHEYKETDSIHSTQSSFKQTVYIPHSRLSSRQYTFHTVVFQVPSFVGNPLVEILNAFS